MSTSCANVESNYDNDGDYTEVIESDPREERVRFSNRSSVGTDSIDSDTDEQPTCRRTVVVSERLNSTPIRDFWNKGRSTKLKTAAIALALVLALWALIKSYQNKSVQTLTKTDVSDERKANVSENETLTIFEIGGKLSDSPFLQMSPFVRLYQLRGSEVIGCQFSDSNEQIPFSIPSAMLALDNDTVLYCNKNGKCKTFTKSTEQWVDISAQHPVTARKRLHLLKISDDRIWLVGDADGVILNSSDWSMDWSVIPSPFLIFHGEIYCIFLISQDKVILFIGPEEKRKAELEAWEYTMSTEKWRLVMSYNDTQIQEPMCGMTRQKNGNASEVILVSELDQSAVAFNLSSFESSPVSNFPFEVSSYHPTVLPYKESFLVFPGFSSPESLVNIEYRPDTKEWKAHQERYEMLFWGRACSVPSSWCD